MIWSSGPTARRAGIVSHDAGIALRNWGCGSGPLGNRGKGLRQRQVEGADRCREFRRRARKPCFAPAVPLDRATQVVLDRSRLSGHLWCATASLGWFCRGGRLMGATRHLADPDGPNGLSALQNANHLRRAGWQRGHEQRAEKEELSKELSGTFQEGSLECTTKNSVLRKMVPL